MRINLDDDERYPTLVVQNVNEKSSYSVDNAVEVPDDLVHDLHNAERELAKAERRIMKHVLDTGQVAAAHVNPEYVS